MRQPLGQRVEPGLGRRVGQLRPARDAVTRRADVDDRPAAVGHHALGDQRRQPERALQVQVDDRVEQLLGHRTSDS